MASENLIAMRKTTKKPQEGDVFVLQPISGIFYFGKVIKTNVESTDGFINGMFLIYIYQYYAHDKEIPQGLDSKELLIAPMIVNNQPWRKGYFETIGNVEVSEKDRSVDFAFWDILKEKYVNIKGQEIEIKPRYCGTYGLGSYGAVGKEVQRAIKNKFENINE